MTLQGGGTTNLELLRGAGGIVAATG